MAKYPRLYGNENSEYDIHDSSGATLINNDNLFDVYKFKNAGQNDNSERSHAVFILKNEQVAGTTTGLEVYSISLLDPDDNSIAYSGQQIALDQHSMEDFPFIGSPEDFTNSQNNKIVAFDTNLNAGVASDTTVCLAEGVLKFSNTVTDITSEDLNPALTTNFKAIPIFNTSDFVHDNTPHDHPIPSDSYVAFVVTFHPTVDIANNTIEAVLKIITNAGSYNINLTVNSFNEIIMVAEPATCSTDNTELIPGSTQIHDNLPLNLGLHPQYKDKEELQFDFLMQGVRIKDISPNAANASYKWVNSAFNTENLNTDDGEGQISQNHSPGKISHFTNLNDASITQYYTNGNLFQDIALAGQFGAYYNVPNNYSLFQRFDISDADEAINYGTRKAAIPTYGLNYTEKKDFARYLKFRVNYLSTQYNNTSSFNPEFPDDGNGTGNQFFNYDVRYGVYEKVTVNQNSWSDTVKNENNPSLTQSNQAGPSYDVDTASTANGNIPQSGSTYSYENIVRWNNYAQRIEAGVTTLASFDIATNTSHFSMNGVKCQTDVVPTSYNTGGDTFTVGTFSHFSFDDTDFKEVTLQHPFTFELKPNDLYPGLHTSIGGSGGSTYLMEPSEDNIGGTMTASLTPKSKDAVWQINDAENNYYPSYPGLHEEHGIEWKANFFPRDSYLKIGLISTQNFYKDAASPGYPNGTGLPVNSQGATDVADVTNWYDYDGNLFTNTQIGLDESFNDQTKKYSGFNGRTYKNTVANGGWETTTTTITTTEDVNYFNWPTKRLIRDKDNAEVNEFIPFNKLIQFPIPSKHSSTDKYTSFQTFLPFNEGDYNIYLHSIDVENPIHSSRQYQLLDFDVASAGNNVHGTSVFGYKPSYNQNVDADTSNDPVLSFHLEASDGNSTWNTSEKVYTQNANYDVSKGVDWYRGGGNTSAFYPPKFLQNFDASGASIIKNLYSVNENGIEDVMSCDQIGPLLTGEINLENSTGEDLTNSPQGNLKLHLKMEVPAKGSTVDFGDYYSTLIIKYYKDNYANRKYINANDSVANTDQSMWTIHEMRVIVKMNVQANPILVIADSEGEEFTDAQEVFMGNVNIG